MPAFRIKRLYDDHLLPRITDWVCGASSVDRQRVKVVPRARGRVLEVGIGTGLNLAHYDRDRVTDLVAIDPGLHPLAEQRARAAGLKVELLPRSAERIPLADDSVDTVVVTYTLCTIPDAASALSEMKRVLAPDGALLFTEHGIAPDPGIARLQRAINRPWGALGGGCQLTRAPDQLIERAGFKFRWVEAMYLPGIRAMNYHTWGEATPAG